MGRMRRIKLGSITIIPIWSDSMGAKSFSVFIDTGDVRIMIDPGVSIMHPSFPISDEEKANYVEKAWNELVKYARKADIVTVTHYHYDHFSPDAPDFYEGKIILAKNPNQYINESQRGRAEEFYYYFYRDLTGKELKFEKTERNVLYENPLKNLKKALSIDYGDYTERKKELLEKGSRWFERLTTKWNKWPLIPEFKVGETRCIFADGRTFKFGETLIKFQEPMFHGIEFSRVGWVTPIIIEKDGVKILYTSDLNGPIIEDYADWIIKENPDILFIDGPATYMIPYTLNLINFKRALNNLTRIIRMVNSKYIFLDHHLTRDVRFRKRLREVYETSTKLHKRVMTFSEMRGKKPLAERIFNNMSRRKEKKISNTIL